VQSPVSVPVGLRYLVTPSQPERRRRITSTTEIERFHVIMGAEMIKEVKDQITTSANSMNYTISFL
jgi:hypothetical protein